MSILLFFWSVFNFFRKCQEMVDLSQYLSLKIACFVTVTVENDKNDNQNIFLKLQIFKKDGTRESSPSIFEK